MGTRHAQYVINKEGERKVAQYGQWDGYPKGQGLDILHFLSTIDLDKFNNEVSKLRVANDEDYERINKFVDEIEIKKLSRDEEKMELRSNAEWYALSRDCGSNLHQLVYDGKVQVVDLIDDEEAHKHCVGFYTIDLQKKKFIAEYRGQEFEWSLDNLPTNDDFLKVFEEI